MWVKMHNFKSPEIDSNYGSLTILLKSDLSKFLYFLNTLITTICKMKNSQIREIQFETDQWVELQ